MNNTPELSVAERSQLQAVRFSQGYEVLLKLMESQCEIFETNLLQTPNHDAAKVISAHNKAAACRDFYEKFQLLVERSCMTTDEAPYTNKLSPEEIIRLQLKA